MDAFELSSGWEWESDVALPIETRLQVRYHFLNRTRCREKLKQP